jgi:hypothetical protein
VVEVVTLLRALSRGAAANGEPLVIPRSHLLTRAFLCALLGSSQQLPADRKGVSTNRAHSCGKSLRQHELRKGTSCNSYRLAVPSPASRTVLAQS